MRKALASGALALVLAFGGGTAAVAQTDTNSGTEQTTNDDGDRGRWGLLGLLGLTGLAGLARRDPVADYRGTGTVGGPGR
jgi:MYXO-CTERM domain-containing protein